MMNKIKDFYIVVVGNVGIDINIYFASQSIDLGTETNFTEILDNVGQSGGYSTRGFAQLGLNTAFIWSVGSNFTGQQILKVLEADSINLDEVFNDPAGTCRSVNIMFPDGRRVSFYDGKSSPDQKPDLKLCKSILTRSNLAHISIPNWARYLLPISKEIGLTISCDLQDITDIDDPYRQDFIHSADILFFSTVNQGSPAPLIEKILQEYPEKIIVSGMGSRGCTLGTKNRI